MRFRKVAKPPRTIFDKVMVGFNNWGDNNHRCAVLLDTWYNLSRLSWMSPLGLKHPLDLLNLGTWYDQRLLPMNDIVLRRLEGLKEDGVSTDEAYRVAVRNELAFAWITLKGIEVSDTPNWYLLNEDIYSYIVTTDFSATKMSDVQFPFSGFHLELPPGRLSMYIDDKEIHPRSLSVGIGRMEREIYEGVSHAVGESCLGKDVIIITSNYFHPKDWSCIAHYFVFDRGATLGEVAVQAPKIDDMTLSQHEDYARMSIGLLNLVVGFMELAKDIKLSKVTQQNKNRIRRKRGLAPLAVNDVDFFLRESLWIFGKKVKLSSHRHSLPDKSVSRLVKDKSTPVVKAKPTPVSGHFRRYRCGPRDDWHYEIRRIESHVRGSGGGPVLGHSYDT